MRKVEAPCPSCGAPVEFKVSYSLVTVCAYCQTVVARGDRKLEDHGKVAALVETNSPLELGATGRYRDKPFELVGHVQYQHAAGGVWDEWYAAFPGERWGWLAEAQGKFYMTFRVKKSAEVALPPSNLIEVGTRVTLPKVGELVVHERSVASLSAAAGELPYVPQPQAQHAFADLTGANDVFATLDLNTEPPTLFLGQQVTLDQIAIAPRAPDDRDAKQISGKGLSCPNCGGSIELRAPDLAERVTCSYCNSLLDVNQGNLVFMTTLDQRNVTPLIPLGTVGTLRGREFTVIGFLRRSVTFEGTKYYWTEYLLYHAKDGFFWLTHSDSHWNFVESIALGTTYPGTHLITYRGMTFRLFQRAVATVRNVLGEFYWKVSAGEEVSARDYVCPPYMISIESTRISQESSEVNVSLGTYVPREEIQAAFKLTTVPRTFGVAPNQPNPTDMRVFVMWPIVLIVPVILFLFFKAVGPAGRVDSTWLWIGMILLSLYPAGTLLYRHSFEKRRWADSEFNPYPTGDDD